MYAGKAGRTIYPTLNISMGDKIDDQIQITSALNRTTYYNVGYQLYKEQQVADSIGSLYAFLFEMLVIIFDWFIYDDCVIVINILFV